MRVVFPNPERGVVPGERALLPGQFVKVRFVGSVRTGVVLVPQRAVQVGPEGPAVYVVGTDEKASFGPSKPQAGFIASGSSKEG